MSYDLTFFRCLPGQSTEEALDFICERSDDVALPPSLRLPSRRIAEALIAAGLKLELHEAEEGIALDPKDATGAMFQFLLSEDQVCLSFPYWDLDHAREADIRDKWAKTIGVFDSFSLTGWDQQLGRETSLRNIDEMLRTCAEVRIAITKKPWWKFW